MTPILTILLGVVMASLAAVLTGRRSGSSPSAAAPSPDPVSRELADLREELAAGELSRRDYEFLRDRLAARMTFAAPGRQPVQAANRWRWPLAGMVAAGLIVATLLPAVRDRSPSGFATGNDFSDQQPLDSGGAAWRQAERAAAAGDYARAVDRYRVAVAFLPEQPELRARFGFALAQARRASEAETQLRLAVRARPRLADARLYLGAVLIARGRRQEARRQWQSFLRLRPQGPDARLVRRTLRRWR